MIEVTAACFLKFAGIAAAVALRPSRSRHTDCKVEALRSVEISGKLTNKEHRHELVLENWPHRGNRRIHPFHVSAAAGAGVKARHDPAILKNSLRWPILRAELPWDGIFKVLFTVLFPGWLALMGLDAVRFDWSGMPDWLQIAGGIGVAAALSSIYRVFEENTSLWRSLRQRTERGRHIISTGPYAVASPAGIRVPRSVWDGELTPLNLLQPR